jgi:hypothetical protein
MPFLQGNDREFFSQGIKKQLPPTDKQRINSCTEKEYKVFFIHTGGPLLLEV